jgi:lipopolysaccharide/colanic/teichoic acid biosynthesis glycosyltransferase
LNAVAKMLFDRSASAIGLIVLAPALCAVLFLVWCRDRRSPLYIAERVGKDGVPFLLVKIRSMVVNADHIGGASSSRNDARITPIGRIIRRWKLDEFSQLWNVLAGDMSLVGPRPQVASEVATYTQSERELLRTKPGITDFSSIVFADEADILMGESDPDLAYRRLVRPWKSRLGLFYIEKSSFWVDLQIILLTLLRLVSPRYALLGIASLLAHLGAPKDLVRVARRETPLMPASVPGRTDPFGA